jgi:oxaloacetate decarboxylase alpha subunit
MDEVRFIDTTIRDGQMSLWATAMTTGMMLPIAKTLDRAGFEAIEIFATALEKKVIRELHESFWERISLVRQRVQRTPLRVIRSRHLAAFHVTPWPLERLWFERMAAHGVRQIRLSDPSNTAGNWLARLETAREFGMDTIINLVFSISPRHTDEYYAEKARAAAALKPYRICLKDPGALLTPERVRTLVPAVLQNVGCIPLELHTHCITGLGTWCCVEAMKLGIRLVNTAIPPLANASSNPSLYAVARNARALGLKPMIDEESLKAVERHVTAIAQREGFPLGAPAEYDAAHYIHQVPGGMISNLRHQLAQVGLESRIDAVLEEIGRVRADFGYPIMVTPYSQFVGVQATMNVVTGERYKVISDEAIHYALGSWGADESASMDATVRDRILSEPRANELARRKPAQPTMDELRAEYGGPGVSDDELLLNYFGGKEHVAAIRPAGETPPIGLGLQPKLIGALEAALKETKVRFFRVQTGDLSLTLKSGTAPQAAE